MEAIERHQIANDWITLLFMAALLLVIVCKMIYPNRFENFAKLAFTGRYFSINQKTVTLTDSFSLLLGAMHVLSVSLFLYLLFSTFWGTGATTPQLFFVQIMLVYALFFSVKYFLEKITATLFEIEKFIDRYLLHKITYRNYIALALLPVTLFLAYASFSLKSVMFAVAGIFVLTNLYVLFLFYQKNRKSISQYWFYFILYLCTFEIAPYFILYKAFANAQRVFA